MKHRVITLIGVAAVAGLMGACANDGSMIGSSLTTSSVDATKTAAAKVDPACNLLSARIDALRKEGVVERAEKVSTGTTSTVSVKRASLAKLAELDKANAEFQAKCSTYVSAPGATTATLTSGAAPAASATKTAAGTQKAAAGVGAAATKSATAPKKAAAKDEAPAQKTPPPVEDAGETKKE